MGKPWRGECPQGKAFCLGLPRSLALRHKSLPQDVRGAIMSVSGLTGAKFWGKKARRS
jgi:hypothetical protein